jgi:hypothetical protein
MNDFIQQWINDNLAYVLFMSQVFYVFVFVFVLCLFLDVRCLTHVKGMIWGDILVVLIKVKFSLSFGVMVVVFPFLLRKGN